MSAEKKVEKGTLIIKAVATDEGTTVDVEGNEICADNIAMCITSLIVMLYKEGIPMKFIKKKLKEYVKLSLKGDKYE